MDDEDGKTGEAVRRNRWRRSVRQFIFHANEQLITRARPTGMRRGGGGGGNAVPNFCIAVLRFRTDAAVYEQRT